MKFGWQTEKEVVLRRAKVSPAKKLAVIRLMNEFFDKALSREQKIRRRQLREAR